MESVLTRSGLWLVALLLAILAYAGAADSGFAVHMAVFGLAALIGLGTLFVVSVIFFPKGLVGYAAPALQRWWSKKP